MQRRERTRRLIELGGLVKKSGLPHLLGDDDASLYGALLTLAATLTNAPADSPPHELVRTWRTRGRRALEAEGGDHGDALR